MQHATRYACAVLSLRLGERSHWARGIVKNSYICISAEIDIVALAKLHRSYKHPPVFVTSSIADQG
jgi:hypothetical protein